MECLGSLLASRQAARTVGVLITCTSTCCAGAKQLTGSCAVAGVGQVRVGLGLHGEPAPLALLEGAALHLTTTTCDGTEVQQVSGADSHTLVPCM